MIYYQVNMIGLKNMNKVDGLLLISGNDIPFPGARLTIHQPTLKEIAYINEASFWMGCELLKFDKNIFKGQDLEKLSQFSNLALLLTMVEDNHIDTKKAKINLIFILALLFPQYKMKFQNLKIILIHSETGEEFIINDENFPILQNIVKQIFCLTNLANKQYDPSGKLAERIARQIKEGQKKRAQLGPINQKDLNIFNRYISILATAKQKSIKEIMDYTVYQLMDEYNRFMLWYSSGQWFKLKIAGATGMDQQPDWFKDIHSNTNEN